MSYRPHPVRADTDPSRPRAWATCDRCGFITNQCKMDWDRQWSGFTVINKRFLVCESCVDVLNEQLRAIVIPADPDPLYNARPEVYAIDEEDFATTNTGQQITTNDGNNIVSNSSRDYGS